MANNDSFKQSNSLIKARGVFEGQTKGGMAKTTLFLSQEESVAFANAVQVIFESNPNAAMAVDVMVGEGQYGKFASLVVREALEGNNQAPANSGGAPQQQQRGGYQPAAKSIRFKSKQV